MSRLLLAKGARGELVKKVQRSLQFTEPDIDGIYGKQTKDGISAFQGTHGLAQTGSVDVDTWGRLTGMPVPAVRDRALGLTADFEGHGFSLAQGNFDGAGITWGIIGFTLKHGELGKIVLEIERRRPDLVRLAFHDLTEKLLEVVQSPLAKQLAFADSVSIPPGKTKLAEPWLSSFRRFGEMEEVQAEQLKLVEQDFFLPAVETARRNDLRSELGLALAFDIHVQNGGIKQTAADQIRRQLPVSSEAELRRIIGNAVADNASQFRDDVRERKLAIASGQGTVHGSAYVLRDWGLDELPV
jgi:peptidoglycan hydrolase-like protein with peptidoglycan-binding domain